MRFVASVTLEDREPFTVTIDSRDIRRWESSFDASWLNSGDLSVTQLCQVAWCAAVRSKQFEGTWDEFDESCVGLDQSGPAESANPT